jgi:hypothetical protein
MLKMNIRFSGILIPGYILLTTFVVFAQTQPKLESLLTSSRIEEANYELVMYQQKGDVVSNLTVVDRRITKEDYHSHPSVKIVETNRVDTPKTKTLIYIDRKTLKPIYFETSADNVLVQKANFEKDKITIVDIINGQEKTSEAPNSGAYLSNSFSELIQANDFGKNRAVKFETVTPGKPANRFVVENVGEKEYSMAGGKTLKRPFRQSIPSCRQDQRLRLSFPAWKAFRTALRRRRKYISERSIQAQYACTQPRPYSYAACPQLSRAFSLRVRPFQRSLFWV